MPFRVLMLTPHNPFYSSYSEVQTMMAGIQGKGGMGIIDVSPHIGLLTLAANTDAEVDYIDERYNPVPLDGEYDLVAISAITDQAKRVVEIADHYRKKKSKVILGGCFPSLSPEIARSGVDSIVIGHAIRLWPKILRDAKNGRLKSVYKDLTPDFSFPVPRYDLVDPENYRSVAVTVGEGCPHGCEFCSIPAYQGHTYRHRPIDEVTRDVDAILKKWPKKPFIYLSDDNLFTERPFIKDLLKALIPYNIKWSAKTFMDIFEDEELLSLIKKSGGRRLLIGFESLSASNLDQINKDKWKSGYLYLYKKAIETIQSYGISVMGQFILGLDHDTQETFNNLEKFICETHLTTPMVNFPIPYPGTPYHERLSREGRILTDDFSLYSLREVVIKPKNMERNFLENKTLELYKKFLSPEYAKSIASYFVEIMKRGSSKT